VKFAFLLRHLKKCNKSYQASTNRLFDSLQSSEDFVVHVIFPFVWGYDRRMKSNPKTVDPYTTFQNALRQVLSVSKQELNRRIAADNASRACKPKRGPKPSSSASGHASDDKG